MKYEIVGGNFPAAIVELEQGQDVFCESGAMAWMTEGIKMKTEAGGIGKLIGRAFTGEKLFRNHYIAESAGKIAFATNVPGEIKAVELNGNSIIGQKGSFLASDPGVEMSVAFQKKVSGALFGGEGIILQKFSGTGTVLVEIDGSAIEYELAAGEKLIIDTGYMVLMDETCTFDVQMVKGLKNMAFGGEGLFNTVVTGPGKVVVQTQPFSQTAATIASMIPTSS